MVKSIKKNFIILGLWAVCFFFSNVPSHASEAKVTFGSPEYNKEYGETFPVGVWIDSDIPIGPYHMEVGYDASILQYAGGGDTWVDNTIIFEGVGTGVQVGYYIYFNAIGTGDALLAFNGAVAQTAEAGNFDDLSVMGPVYVHVSGSNSEVLNPTENDTDAGDNSLEDQPGDAAEVEESIVEEAVSEEVFESVDAGKGVETEDLDADTSVETNSMDEYLISDNAGIVNISCRKDSNGNISRSIYSSDREIEYPVYELQTEEDFCILYFTPLAVPIDKWPEGLTADIIKSAGVYCFLDESRNLYFAKYDYSNKNELIPWNADIKLGFSNKISRGEIAVFVFALSLVCCIVGGLLIYKYLKMRRIHNSKLPDGYHHGEHPFDYEDI